MRSWDDVVGPRSEGYEEHGSSLRRQLPTGIPLPSMCRTHQDTQVRAGRPPLADAPSLELDGNQG
jgi:hypothetical protein